MPFCISTTSNATNKFKRPLSYAMNFFMFFWGYKQKIFQAIVLRIFIFMMYVNTFWGISKKTMLVFPFIWLCNFYFDVHTAISCFVQMLTANRKLHTDLIYNLLFNFFYFFSQCFIRTVWATRRIMISLAISAFLSHNRGVAKRAWFGKKSFHAIILCQV